MDGFNGGFYRATWPIISTNLLEAINNVLRSGKLLNQVNHTILCLVPKIEVPATVNDFHPIALCNVFYKILSKILSNRIRPLMPKLIDHNQNAFIKGRKISDSILLAHELCHNLYSGQGRARMCIKLDLSKAFDSLDRSFICETSRCMGFDNKWIGWLSKCLNSSFSLRINGEYTPPFSSSNGVRQGDPLSPYLFVIAMQVLSSLFKKAEQHQELDPMACGTLSVSHIIFADDLMVFLKADKKNAWRLKQLLDEFSKLSGLSINYAKSAIYFEGSVQH